jgi:hypothetical protein
VLITTSYDRLQDRVLAQARLRYAGFATATLLIVLIMVLLVGSFLRRSNRLKGPAVAEPSLGPARRAHRLAEPGAV